MGLRRSPTLYAWLWRWQDIYSIAEHAGKLFLIERGGDCRAIPLSNPGHGDLSYVTSMLWADLQWLSRRHRRQQGGRRARGYPDQALQAPRGTSSSLSRWA